MMGALPPNPRFFTLRKEAKDTTGNWDTMIRMRAGMETRPYGDRHVAMDGHLIRGIRAYGIQISIRF